MADGKARSMVRGFLSDRFRPFVEITEKYRTPRIKMTRQVRIALLLLRIYLIFIVGLLIFKFFTSV
jgi:hypothetical protein